MSSKMSFVLATWLGECGESITGMGAGEVEEENRDWLSKSILMALKIVF